MSIAVLNQVYDEMRRLGVAGSSAAVGDFRLKKLLPPLEHAGAKAPVFARVAEVVKTVVDSTEQSAPTALLDLTALVNAILFTQGETGVAGTFAEIETVELPATTAQISAHTLKALLKALNTTGGGRLELVREGYERDVFRDFRLVRPALDALDDSFSEIADFIAERVVPLYGKAIVPELRSRFDHKGRGGHARRLRLLNQLDPVGSQELITKALEEGSKEVKVAAIACLGTDVAHLSLLIEQAGAKAQEVRLAAYQGLAYFNDDAAVAVLHKAMLGKDLDLAEHALTNSQNERLLSQLLKVVDTEIDELLKIKDKAVLDPKLTRVRTLLRCLHGRTDLATEKLILRLFNLRWHLDNVKGTSQSGSDLNAEVVRLMAAGTTKIKTMVAEAHATLTTEELGAAFSAARSVFPADQVFDRFSCYLIANNYGKKKTATEQREVICRELVQHERLRRHGRTDLADFSDLDGRWLDLALDLENLDLIGELARPGHARAEAFLKEKSEAVFAEAESLYECHWIVTTLVSTAHQDATDAVCRCLDKFGSTKADYFSWWVAGQMIPGLPAAAIPKLEALLPSLAERVADAVLGGIQRLKDKHKT